MTSLNLRMENRGKKVTVQTERKVILLISDRRPFLKHL